MLSYAADTPERHAGDRGGNPARGPAAMASRCGDPRPAGAVRNGLGQAVRNGPGSGRFARLAGPADSLYASGMTAEGEAGPGAAPEAGMPAAGPPAAAGPGMDAPAVDAPAVDAPAVDAPAVEAQRVEAAVGPPVTGAAERVADGIAHLEQAVAAFSEAAESAEADIVPLAIELLARTLPLCERDEESAWAWQRGLEHPDPAVAAAVRQRLRRAFG